MPASDQDSTSSSSDEDEGDRLTLEQELGVANVLLALKENRIADAKNIAESLPREIAKIEKAPANPRITLKTIQLEQIEKPEARIIEDCRKVASDISANLNHLEAKYDLSDEEEDTDGLVESTSPPPPVPVEKPTAEAKILLARAIGCENEEDKFLQKYFCEELWKSSSEKNETMPSFGADSEATKESKAELEVIVRELDDDLDELRMADAHEAFFNFRHERGAKNAITGSHDREQADMFDVVREPSKRALKSREQLAEKKLKIQAAKDQLVADLEPYKGLPTPNEIEADEDYPSEQEWFLCDGCSQPIMPTKVMFVCAECPDYALCKSCQKNKVRHDHPLTRSKCPASAVPPKSWKLSIEPVEDIAEGRGKALAAQILRELSFIPDQNYKYISCNSKEEKRSISELLASAQVDDATEVHDSKSSIGEEKKIKKARKIKRSTAPSLPEV